MKLKTGKTCSKDDRIVAEMILALPEEAFDVLCDVFRLRILNHPGADDAGSFSKYEMTLLMKIADPRSMRQWRPIAVLSVLAKLYSSVIGD